MIGKEAIRENAKTAVNRFGSLSKLGAEFRVQPQVGGVGRGIH